MQGILAVHQAAQSSLIHGAVGVAFVQFGPNVTLLCTGVRSNVGEFLIDQVEPRVQCWSGRQEPS